MQNEQWPFNGKSLWKSLRNSQRFATIVGVPITATMMNCCLSLIDMVPFIWIRAVLMFVSILVVPFVYVRGIGMVFVAMYELIMNRR